MNISDFTLYRFLTCCSQKREILPVKIYSQKLQNNAGSHYPTTIFALCIYFLQYKTPLFRTHVFRTRRLVVTNLNFKVGALRHEMRRVLAFYTGTSCLIFFTSVQYNHNAISYYQFSTRGFSELTHNHNSNLTKPIKYDVIFANLQLNG